MAKQQSPQLTADQLEMHQRHIDDPDVKPATRNNRRNFVMNLVSNGFHPDTFDLNKYVEDIMDSDYAPSTKGKHLSKMSAFLGDCYPRKFNRDKLLKTMSENNELVQKATKTKKHSVEHPKTDFVKKKWRKAVRKNPIDPEEIELLKVLGILIFHPALRNDPMNLKPLHSFKHGDDAYICMHSKRMVYIKTAKTDGFLDCPIDNEVYEFLQKNYHPTAEWFIQASYDNRSNWLSKKLPAFLKKDGWDKYNLTSAKSFRDLQVSNEKINPDPAVFVEGCDDRGHSVRMASTNYAGQVIDYPPESDFSDTETS